MKKFTALFVFLAVTTACIPTPLGTLAPVAESTQEPVQVPTAIPTLSDSQFYELPGAVRINAVAEYAIGVLPSPAKVTLADGEGIAIALVVKGEDLPVDVSTFLTATVMDITRHVYPAKLAIEMGCWPKNLADTQEAWFHKHYAAGTVAFRRQGKPLSLLLW